MLGMDHFSAVLLLLSAGGFEKRNSRMEMQQRCQSAFCNPDGDCLSDRSDNGKKQWALVQMRMSGVLRVPEYYHGGIPQLQPQSKTEKAIPCH